MQIGYYLFDLLQRALCYRRSHRNEANLLFFGHDLKDRLVCYRRKRITADFQPSCDHGSDCGEKRILECFGVLRLNTELLHRSRNKFGRICSANQSIQKFPIFRKFKRTAHSFFDLRAHLPLLRHTLRMFTLRNVVHRHNAFA